MTYGSILNPRPSPELLESILDLSRPELSEVMDRYTTAVMRRPVALVVERPDLDPKPLKEELAKEGWEVQTCAGPSGSVCPLMTGQSCDLREGADVAIVYLDRRANPASANSIPRLRCAAHEASPGVVAIEGSVAGPQYADRVATVGALREPSMIMHAIRALLARQGPTH